ncbi:MAG TPA: hypothetical protein DDY26_03920 [Moraxellaceae bacterium]|nr:CAP domain-containing protein [Moraxella sp.]HBI48960.1 hypothetical protein [Moraxellaceae bacterium]
MDTLLSNNFFNRAIILTLLATSLTACGGGGESGNSGSSSTPSSSTLPTPIPTPTTNSTVELAAMKLLNENRSQCGFGSLTANQNLNLTAMNHANYLASVTETNKQPFASHEEQAETGLLDTGITNPYHSGINLTARLNPSTLGKNAVNTHYNYQAQGENISLSNVSTKDSSYTVNDTATVEAMLYNLFAAPYHLRSLVYPQFTEVGVSYQLVKWTANNEINHTSLLEIVSALPSSQKYIENTKLLNFPCDGVTTDYQLTDETPNPFGTTRNLKDQPTGQPVYVLAPFDKTIAEATATITQNGTSIGMIHTLTSLSDPNQLLSKNEVIFIPDLPLKPNTSYQVSYQLVYNDGQKTTHQFTFKTRPS